MQYDAVMIDLGAAEFLAMVGEFPATWLDDFRVPTAWTSLSLRVIDDSAFVLSDSGDSRAGGAVIRLGDRGLFRKIPQSRRRTIFMRTIQAALSVMVPGVVIPMSWVPFRYKNLVTFYGSSAA